MSMLVKRIGPALLALVFIGCAGGPLQPSSEAPSATPPPPSVATTAPTPAASPGVATPTATAGTAAPARENPFGLMLPSQLVRSSQGMAIAKELGVVYFRPAAIFLDEWNGSCPECDIGRDAGLQLVLTVRNNGRRQASSPPDDLAAYRRVLGQVLDAYRPAVLVVENEENSALFYTGTPEDYAAELEAACQVAHARGVPCTNGGLVSTLVALLAYNHYRQGAKRRPPRTSPPGRSHRRRPGS